ncbi:hypothetical protein CHS0354_020670 [Potamilus streckersoni]|uniref:RRM domain-containing protein n=1 Tax=Potamilus streckersoni TaxID=2493646 RepID=A0AAE0SQS5_9BIVA|nr:hypothetical protein CHS0354_020670 [Potamilus streckersoni]
MHQFVSVTEDENEESVEIPCEEDGTLLITNLSAQFPGACGLKYRSSSGGLRGVRLGADGKLHPPEDEQWGPITYLAVFPKDTKRKGDDAVDNPVAKIKRKDSEVTSDLIVLGLPYSSTEEDMRKYFSQFGELVLVQVKKYPKTGVSKGFGFIRFATVESQSKCLSQRHMIGGRWCDVNLTNSDEGIGGQAAMSMKIFVARCTEDMTTDDLRDYFSKFGEVLDVFIPKPFRSIAFVTFQDAYVAQSLCGEDHIIKGNSVHISNAAPKKRDPHAADRRGRGPAYGPPFHDRRSGRWGAPARNYGHDFRGMDTTFNNIGMNVLSSAMLAAAQAVLSGQTTTSARNRSVCDNYENLGPGFGGTRDTRGPKGGYSSGFGDSHASSSGSGYRGWSGHSRGYGPWGRGSWK